MGRKRDKHKSQQPPGRGVLPDPPPGFDIGAHYLRQMTELYNRGVLRFGDADKFLIITKMESKVAVLQKLEGSMTHDCLPLDDILKTEPDYLRRICLATPPGPGYARCTLYDLSRPEYPVATAWFNPLLRSAMCWIPGDNRPAAADTATGAILGQTTDQVGTPGASGTSVADTPGCSRSGYIDSPDSSGFNMAKLQHDLMCAQVEVSTDKNEYCLSRGPTIIGPESRSKD